MIVFCLQEGFSQQEFSEISGTSNRFSEVVKLDEGYAAYLQPLPGQPIGIYRISENGAVTDSVDMRNLIQGGFFSGTIGSFDGRVFYGGLFSSSNPSTQGFAFIEFDEQLNAVNEVLIPSEDTLRGFLRNAELNDGFINRLFDFKVEQDTIMAVGSFLLFNPALQSIGSELRYIRANFNGEIYNYQTIPGSLYNAFFFGDKFAIQGSVAVPGEFSPKAVGTYNRNGEIENGWIFDNSGSGEFPWMANGGEIDGKYYFSYVGRDPSLPGCNENNIAIDVRDAEFNILHRFKLEECGYGFTGNMPFTKSIDGDIFFQAVSMDFSIVLIQRYTDDMQLVWSKEFDFDVEYPKINPVRMLASEDGGILLHCTTARNADRRLRLFKISGDGEIVSSSVENEVAYFEKLKIFPNPAFTDVTIDGLIEKASVDIYDMNGTLVGRRKMENNTLDVRHLNSGMYIVHIKTATINETHRLIKIE